MAARAEAAPFRYPEGRHGRGELRYYQNVPVLIARGTHAEMGEQIGVLALKPAAKVIALVEGFANRALPSALRPVANATMRAMFASFPLEYRQELEAMAEAADAKLNSLVLANTIIDLQEVVGCSSLLVSAERSQTGGPLYGRNMDLPYVEGLAEYSLLIVYVPTEGHAYAMPNLPGFLMLASGMNDQGLALGSQSVGAPKAGTARFNPAGVASAVAGRRLMEKCGTVDSAQEWLEAHPLARCVSIAACDPRRQAVFEVTTERTLVRDGADGICAATNHFRCGELAQETNCWRYSILDGAKQVERVELKMMFDALKAVNQDKMTVHSMVFEPSVLRMHLTMGSGPATDRAFTPLELRNLFSRN